MSKCREAFKAHCKERMIDLESHYAIDLYFDWQAAWNARGKVDAEIARTPVNGEQDDITMAAKDRIAEAIEQEQCE